MTNLSLGWQVSQICLQTIGLPFLKEWLTGGASAPFHGKVAKLVDARVRDEAISGKRSTEN
jgi:hypothetical protein